MGPDWALRASIGASLSATGEGRSLGPAQLWKCRNTESGALLPSCLRALLFCSRVLSIPVSLSVPLSDQVCRESAKLARNRPALAGPTWTKFGSMSAKFDQQLHGFG